jgi:hypothetical protein
VSVRVPSKSVDAAQVKAALMYIHRGRDLWPTAGSKPKFRPLFQTTIVSKRYRKITNLPWLFRKSPAKRDSQSGQHQQIIPRSETISAAIVGNCFPRSLQERRNSRSAPGRRACSVRDANGPEFP